MEFSTDLCFGDGKMAPERCREAHTGRDPLRFCTLLAPTLARPYHHPVACRPGLQEGVLMTIQLEQQKPDALVQGLVGRDAVRMLFRDKECQG
jgi:hypothetical protein